ncbi:hypothetical protein THAR02_10529 [Trichoderma harzianum]|uniref:Uncharacterized protein n=1 Tax=Trichoderma harzianum TaxID=5544 RepID=A0A0F9X9B5_TRIHA|nr:hypothetical protein THAR02_10529 [Trichoderma harzianum]
MLELEPAHPSTLGQQARSPPGEELNGMIRWSAKATAHFFVAFQADGDKGESSGPDLDQAPQQPYHYAFVPVGTNNLQQVLEQQACPD